MKGQNGGWYLAKKVANNPYNQVLAQGGLFIQPNAIYAI